MHKERGHYSALRRKESDICHDAVNLGTPVPCMIPLKAVPKVVRSTEAEGPRRVLGAAESVFSGKSFRLGRQAISSNGWCL